MPIVEYGPGESYEFHKCILCLPLCLTLTVIQSIHQKYYSGPLPSENPGDADWENLLQLSLPVVVGT